MKTQTISQALSDEMKNASIELLTKQRDALLAQNAELSKIVRSIPQIIVSARLDTKQGIETKYDYAKAEKALALGL
jgi:phage portal protein BeeE